MPLYVVPAPISSGLEKWYLLGDSMIKLGIASPLGKYVSVRFLISSFILDSIVKLMSFWRSFKSLTALLYWSLTLAILSYDSFSVSNLFILEFISEYSSYDARSIFWFCGFEISC